MATEAVSATTDINVSLSDAYNRGEKDINFFASLCMPTICVFALPNFYVAIFRLLANRTPNSLTSY